MFNNIWQWRLLTALLVNYECTVEYINCPRICNLGKNSPTFQTTSPFFFQYPKNFCCIDPINSAGYMFSVFIFVPLSLPILLYLQ